jgi:host factor-I protein
VNRRLIRPPLNSVKESFGSAGQPTQPPRKKPTPPEQTHAENFYFVKQMQARTPVTVVLSDGETLHGTVEWYDRDCIKLTRYGSPNLLVYKHAIKYIYKNTEDAAGGGTNGGGGPNGNS